MCRELRYWFIFSLLMFFPTTALSQLANQFSGMEGWTIAATTKVDGEFEGCEFGKMIQFLNGFTLECSTYHYTYSYMPDAVIFVRTLNHEGKAFFQVKALIGDHVYDMSPMPTN